MTGDASKPAVLVEEGKRPLWPIMQSRWLWKVTWQLLAKGFLQAAWRKLTRSCAWHNFHGRLMRDTNQGGPSEDASLCITLHQILQGRSGPQSRRLRGKNDLTPDSSLNVLFAYQYARRERRDYAKNGKFVVCTLPPVGSCFDFWLCIIASFA